eukprot:13325730-Alexandrium_andersonii.AAC.1
MQTTQARCKCRCAAIPLPRTNVHAKDNGSCKSHCKIHCDPGKTTPGKSHPQRPRMEEGAAGDAQDVDQSNSSTSNGQHCPAQGPTNVPPRPAKLQRQQFPTESNHPSWLHSTNSQCSCNIPHGNQRRGQGGRGGDGQAPTPKRPSPKASQHPSNDKE